MTEEFIDKVIATCMYYLDEDIDIDDMQGVYTQILYEKGELT